MSQAALPEVMIVKTRSASPDRDHDDTLEWLAQQPGLLDEYVDEWVAIVGHEIVAHAPSVIDAVREAKERGYDDPLLVPVMPPDVLIH